MESVDWPSFLEALYGYPHPKLLFVSEGIRHMKRGTSRVE
jgi:hypothetical protein